MLQYPFIRNIDVDSLSENFLLSAVATVLGVRFYLFVTGYPQIGMEGLHFAHLLWGGLLMLIAFVLLFSFLNKSIISIASILAGAGFGLFVDETGKFITSDNNYFFQPTVAIMYVIFVSLYLSFHAIENYRKFSKKEYLVNSIEMMKEAVINDLSVDEKRVALAYLAKSDKNNEITKILQKAFADIDAVPSGVGFFSRTQRFIQTTYDTITGKKWFIVAINTFFIFQAIASVVFTVVFAMGIGLQYIQPYIPAEIVVRFRAVTFADMVELTVGAFASIFVVAGVIAMYRSRLAAYLLFKRYILISLFLVQVFSFYHNQFSAMIGFVFDVFVLIALNYMIADERIRRKKMAQA